MQVDGKLKAGAVYWVPNITALKSPPESQSTTLKREMKIIASAPPAYAGFGTSVAIEPNGTQVIAIGQAGALLAPCFAHSEY